MHAKHSDVFMLFECFIFNLYNACNVNNWSINMGKSLDLFNPIISHQSHSLCYGLHNRPLPVVTCDYITCTIKTSDVSSITHELISFNLFFQIVFSIVFLFFFCFEFFWLFFSFFFICFFQCFRFFPIFFQYLFSNFLVYCNCVYSKAWVIHDIYLTILKFFWKKKWFERLTD